MIYRICVVLFSLYVKYINYFNAIIHTDLFISVRTLWEKLHLVEKRYG